MGKWFFFSLCKTMTSSSCVYSHHKNIFFLSVYHQVIPLPSIQCRINLVLAEILFFKLSKNIKLRNWQFYYFLFEKKNDCCATLRRSFFLQGRIQGQHLRTTSGNWRITRNKKKEPRCVFFKSTKNYFFYFPFLLKYKKKWVNQAALIGSEWKSGQVYSVQLPKGLEFCKV
jgi:hypothetical protein